MSRYYSTFDNSMIAALELNTPTYRFLRIPFTGNGATIRQDLLDKRAALDAAVRSQITAANNDGTRGVVVPRDAMSRGASSISVSNLYTNPSAVSGNPRSRPTADITIANSTPVAPANPITIPNAAYDAATLAVTQAVTGAGVYSRLGKDASKTMRSIYHDAALTFFAWDSYTPEVPIADIRYAQWFQVGNQADYFGGTPVTVLVTWTWGHPTDQEAVPVWHISITDILNMGGTGGSTVASANGVGATGEQSASYNRPSGFNAGYRYQIDLDVFWRYSDGTEGPTLRQTGTFDAL